MAVRGLRIRRCNCLGLDGDLHLPSESLCVAFAYTHSDGNRDANSDANGNANSNGQTYSNSKDRADTEASPDASASAVTPADRT